MGKKRRGDHDERDSKKSKSKSKAPEDQLSSDDYFARNSVFTLWLRKKKDVYFDQLPADKARKYFDKFVKKWNEGDLSDRYYDHVDGGDKKDKAAARTGFKWKFNMDKQEKDSLTRLRGLVQHSSQIESLSNKVSTTASMAAADQDRDSRRFKDRKDKRDYRKHKDLVLDEITGGKATGHEAKMEKKRGARMARAERDVSPDHPGGNPYGGTGFKDEVRKKEARFQKKKETRKVLMQGKLEAHKQNEDSKMAALMAMAKANRSSNALWQPS